jgi:hypothetical protein
MESDKEAVVRILRDLAADAQQVLKAVLHSETESLHRKTPSGVVDEIVDEVRRIVK